MEIVKNLKENICYVSDTPLSQRNVSDLKGQTYELPDGSTIELAAPRCSFAEKLFTPQPHLYGFQGIQQMIIDSITKTDLDIRKDLYSNVILVGGNTLLNGFYDRINKTMPDIAPQNMKYKIISNTNNERRFGSFIGGSILSSLGSF